MSSLYERSERGINPEEWRLFIASVVGAARVAHGRRRQITLDPDVPTLLFDKVDALVLYTEIRVITVPAATTLLLAPSSSISSATSPGQLLTAAAIIPQVLMKGERLYGRVNNATTFLLIDVVA